MIPTHKDCINFKDGVCTLLGVPVNPNGPACPRFTAKTPTQPTTTTAEMIHPPLYLQRPRSRNREVDLNELKRRLDKMEDTLREIKAMLKSVQSSS